MSARPLFAALALLFANAPALAGQADTLVCAVVPDSDRRVQWPPDANGALDPDGVPPLDSIRRLMSGRFSMLVVTTEGTPSHQSEWLDVRLFPTSEAGLRRCYAVRCSADYENPVAGPVGGALTTADSVILADNGFVKRPALRLRVIRGRNTAVLSDLDVSDAGGALYFVTEVTGDGFSGWWSDGGMWVTPVQRGGRTVYERPGGYFCAWRR